MVILNFGSLLEDQENEMVDSLNNSIDFGVFKMLIWLKYNLDLCLSHVRPIILMTAVYDSGDLSQLREALVFLVSVIDALRVEHINSSIFTRISSGRESLLKLAWR